MGHGTDHCRVDLRHADILPQHRKMWHEGRRCYTEELILPGDELYSIGLFSSLDSDQVQEILEFELNYSPDEAAAHAASLARQAGVMHHFMDPNSDLHGLCGVFGCAHRPFRYALPPGAP